MTGTETIGLSLVTFREDGEVFTDVVVKGTTTLVATLPLDGVDIERFDDQTRFDLQIGSGRAAAPIRLHAAGKPGFNLGDDSSYRPGKKSAKLRIVGDDDRPAGSVVLRWTKRSLTLIITLRTGDQSGIDPFFALEFLDAEEPEPRIVFESAIDLQFAEANVIYGMNGTGSRTVTTRRIGRGKDAETLRLPKVQLSVKANRFTPGVGVAGT
jgi:hypothetical protein